MVPRGVGVEEVEPRERFVATLTRQTRMDISDICPGLVRAIKLYTAGEESRTSHFQTTTSRQLQSAFDWRRDQ